MTINLLYSYWLDKLIGDGHPAVEGSTIEPFHILCTLIVKESDLAVKPEPKTGPFWKKTLLLLKERSPINACTDIVGDTICADFLDYIHRDWYHIGKPIQVDDRIYEYMRILPQTKTNPPSDTVNEYKFVIDIGPKLRLRHDALTLILDLLESRYKLAETVLFHRTKLGVIALLDRIMLEILDLWRAAGIGGPDGPHQIFQDYLLELLMSNSDDRLELILDRLREGTPKFSRAINRTTRSGIATGTKMEMWEGDSAPSLVTDDESNVVDITLHRKKSAIADLDSNIEQLIGRLSTRNIFTIAEKIDVAAVGGVPAEKNHYVQDIIDIYSLPQNRYKLLRCIETECGLPRGSVLMYCPISMKMGAKLAKVNLHVDGRILPFDRFEEEGGATGLTCNALAAQVSRFYQHWAVSFFVDRSIWAEMGHDKQGMFRRLVRTLFLPMADPQEAAARRTEANALLAELRVRATPMAARSGAELDSVDLVNEAGEKWTLPNGLEIPSLDR